MASALSSVIAGIFMYITQRRITKHDKKRERREEQERQARETHEAAARKERVLQTRLISADLKLTQAIAVAIRDGKTNGEMKAAMAECEEAKREYYEFLNEQAYKHIA